MIWKYRRRKEFDVKILYKKRRYFLYIFFFFKTWTVCVGTWCVCVLSSLRYKSSCIFYEGIKIHKNQITITLNVDFLKGISYKTVYCRTQLYVRVFVVLSNFVNVEILTTVESGSVIIMDWTIVKTVLTI